MKTKLYLEVENGEVIWYSKGAPSSASGAYSPAQMEITSIE